MCVYVLLHNNTMAVGMYRHTGFATVQQRLAKSRLRPDSFHPPCQRLAMIASRLCPGTLPTARCPVVMRGRTRSGRLRQLHVQTSMITILQHASVATALTLAHSFLREAAQGPGTGGGCSIHPHSAAYHCHSVGHACLEAVVVLQAKR